VWKGAIKIIKALIPLFLLHGKFLARGSKDNKFNFFCGCCCYCCFVAFFIYSFH
jgi:hypothetical protein